MTYGTQNQQCRPRVLSYYSMLMYSPHALASKMIIRDSWVFKLSEVKFSDLLKTNYCESVCQECFH